MHNHQHNCISLLIDDAEISLVGGESTIRRVIPLRRINFRKSRTAYAYVFTRIRTITYVYTHRSAYRSEETSVKFSRMDGPADLESVTKSTNRTRACILHADDQRIRSQTKPDGTRTIRDLIRTSPVFTTISDTNRGLNPVK